MNTNHASARAFTAAFASALSKLTETKGKADEKAVIEAVNAATQKELDAFTLIFGAKSPMQKAFNEGLVKGTAAAILLPSSTEEQKSNMAADETTSPVALRWIADNTTDIKTVRAVVARLATMNK